MFLRFLSPTKANLQLAREAVLSAVFRARSQKENSAFRTTPSFLCTQQTLLNDISLLPDMSESRNSLYLRGLTVSGPDAQCQSTEDIPWHQVLQQNGVSAQPDTYSIAASSAPFQEPNLTAAFPSCSQTQQSPVHSGSWRIIPLSLGSHCPQGDPSLPWPAPSSSQRWKSLQTAPSVHSREKLHKKAWACTCNCRCKWIMVN